MQISVKGEIMKNVKLKRRLSFGLFAALVVGTVGAIVGSSKGVVETRAAGDYTATITAYIYLSFKIFTMAKSKVIKYLEVRTKI